MGQVVVVAGGIGITPTSRLLEIALDDQVRVGTGPGVAVVS